MIGAGVLGDAKLGAQERGTDFRDQLFGRIGILLEAGGEVAVTARFMISRVAIMPISA